MSYTISPDVANVLLSITPMHKVTAIKELRRITGCGLKESKDAIESGFAVGGVVTISSKGSKGSEGIIDEYIKMQMYQASVFEKLLEKMT